MKYEVFITSFSASRGNFSSCILPLFRTLCYTPLSCRFACDFCTILKYIFEICSEYFNITHIDFLVQIITVEIKSNIREFEHCKFVLIRRICSGVRVFFSGSEPFLQTLHIVLSVKVKVSRNMRCRHRAQRILTSGLDGCEWLTPRPGHFTRWKERRYPLYMRLS